MRVMRDLRDDPRSCRNRWLAGLWAAGEGKTNQNQTIGLLQSISALSLRNFLRSSKAPAVAFSCYVAYSAEILKAMHACHDL